jgi:hypothetical protein
MRSRKDTTKVVATLTPNVVNDDTDGTGVGVDLRGYGSALVVCHVGVSGDTLSGSVKLLPTLQESNTLASGYTDVAAAEIDGAFTLVDDAAEDPAVQVVSYLGDSRYVRVLIDTTGTHTVGTPCSAVVVLGDPTYAPTV